MNTGVFIRIETEKGKWENLDIADKKIPFDKLQDFLYGKTPAWLIGLIFILLDRHPE